MDKITDFRNKWDDIFNDRIVTYFVKIVGAVCIYFSSSALSQLFPFIDRFTGQMLVLVALAVAIVFFFNETFAMVIFGFVLLAGMSGGQAAVALFAAIAVMFVCGNSRFVCMLAALVPLCLMNIEIVELPLLSVNLPYAIFFLCVYFNGKIGTTTWKYAFPVYYTLVAYNFGLYGTIVKDFFATTWPAPEKTVSDAITLFVRYAGFEKDFEILDITSILILVLINLVICYVVYSLINLKNIKFINLQVDIRDLIAFVTAIILVILGFITITKLYNPELVVEYTKIILHGLIVYLISRPFASYKVCAALQKKKSNYEEQLTRKATEGNNFIRTLKEEIDSILETHLIETKYQEVLIADKTPINSILIFGKNELDKHFVIENLLSNTGIKTTYCIGEKLLEEYISSGNITALENLENNKELEIIVLEEVEKLVNSNSGGDEFNKKLIKYIIDIINRCKSVRKVLFIMTTDSPEELPEILYTDNCIDKILYGSQNDSVLLNNTYRVIKPIGKGGAGVVYKAYHENLDTHIVVKKMLDGFTDSNSYKAEASVLKQLKHTYLPKVYDVFEENKEFYTVMDYIPGESLQEKITREGAQPQQQVLKWGKQLIEAVEYLHNQEKPIIHSDIKPGNIILTPAGNISLIDFNISIMFERSNTKSIGATPGYSPIEQYGSIENYHKVLESRGIKRKQEKIVQSFSTEETVVLECPETELLENTVEIPTSNVTKNMQLALVADKEMEVFAKSGLSEKSDIYSIGATLYTLITGEKPSLDYNNIKSILDYDLNISEEFSALISKAMSVNPNNRYKSITEMKHAVDQIQ